MKSAPEYQRRSAIINSVAVFSAKIIKGFSAVVLAWLVARAYGSEGSGYFYLAFTIVMVASQIAQLGLYQGSLKFIPAAAFGHDKGGVRELVAAILLLVLLSAGIVAALTGIFSDMLATSVFNQPFVGELLFRMAPIVAAWAVVSVMASVMQAQNDMRGIVYYENLLLPIGSISVATIAWLAGWSLQLMSVCFSLVYASVMLMIVRATVNRGGGLLRMKQALYKFDRQQAGTILGYSVTLMAAGIIQQAMMWMDTLMIGYFMRPADVGVYNVAVRVALASTILLYVVNSTITPFISNACAASDWDTLKTLYHKSVYYLVLLSFPAIFLIAVYSEELVSVFGKDFTAAALPLVILLVGQFINIATGPAGFVLTLSGRQRLEVMNILLTLIMNIILNIILIPRYGIIGAAIATATSMSCINLIRALQNTQLAGLPWVKKDLLQLALCMVLATGMWLGATKLLSHNPVMPVIVPAIFSILVMLIHSNKLFDIFNAIR